MVTETVQIGLINPKSPQNVGAVLRAAGCYGAKRVVYTGERFAHAQKYATDTKNRQLEIPLIGVDSIQNVREAGQKIVAFELVEGATPLPRFEHPPHAFYLFGPEDGSIEQAIIDQCDEVIYVPTQGCMNLAASVNVVLYDRLAKRADTQFGDHLIRRNRDTNNNTIWRPKA